MAKKNKKTSARAKKSTEEVKNIKSSEAAEIPEISEIPDIASIPEITGDTAADLTEETESEKAEEKAAEETESEKAEEKAAEKAESEEAEEEVSEEAESEEAEEEVAEKAESEEAEEKAAEETESEKAEEKAAEETESEEAEEEAAEETESEEAEEEVAEETESEEAEEEVAEEAESEEAEEEAAEETESEEAEEEAAEKTDDVVEFDFNEVDDEDSDEVDNIQFVGDSGVIADLFDEDDVADANSTDDSVDLFEEASAAAQDVSDDEQVSAEEVVDDDDYLDYDDDIKVKRPKKIVSGKAAVLTMLFTLVGMIAITAGIFSFLTYYQKDIGLSLVSYSDRFNECDANSFSYGEMLGLGDVSYSDTEMSLTEQDIKDLKSGKTVTKFNGMANIKADIRFGKIVSMDFSFSDELNNAESPSGYYMMLAGNVLSGLYPGIETSDYGFMFAYSVLSYATATEDNENIYCYQMDGVNFYIDYTEAIETGLLSKLTIHVESADLHYIDWSEVDLSWIPWNKNNVSASDVSASDNY